MNLISNQTSKIQKIFSVFTLVIMLFSQVTSIYAALSPLQDALVQVDGSNGDGYATTDANGGFIITEGFGAGSYSVDISHKGYITKTVNTVITAGIETNLGDIEIKASGKITGNARTSGGSPASNVTVVCRNESNNDTVGMTQTLSDGSFTFDTDLSTATYTIIAATISAFGFTGIPGQASNMIKGVNVVEGQTTSGVIINLIPSGTLTGTVKDQSNNLIAGVGLWMLDTSGIYGGFATTDAQGKYTISSNLGSGVYALYIISAKGYVLPPQKNATITAGQTTTVDWVAKKSGVISGQVKLANGATKADITVSAISLNYQGVGSAKTNSDGTYSIDTGLDTGQYMVYAGGDFLSQKTVNVTSGAETRNVDFTITKNLAWIAGTVKNSTSNPLVAANLNASGASIQGTDSTDNDGKYTIELTLPPGVITTQVNVTASMKGYISKSSLVTVTLGQTITLDYNLQRIVGGSLKGRVVAAYVPPPKKDAALTALLSTQSMFLGTPLSISGTLNPARTGSITIKQSVNGSALTTLTTTSLTNGSYSYTFTPATVGSYQFKVNWLGDTEYNAAESQTASVTVSLKTVTANISAPTTIFSGGTGLITLQLTSDGTPLTGATVSITADKGTITQVTDSGGGTYTAQLTAPTVTTSTTCKVSYTASKTGYISSTGQKQVTILPPGTLNMVLTSSPTTVYSGGTSTINVTVSSQATPVQGATIIISPAQGSLTTISDLGNGTYTSTYTAPEVTTQTTSKLTAKATKTGFTNSTAEIEITVKPLTLTITVKGSDGATLADASLQSTAQPTGQATLSKTTGSDGTATFTGIIKGSYTFKATKTGYDDKTWTITVKTGQETAETATLTKTSGGGIPGFPQEAIIIGAALSIAMMTATSKRRLLNL
jgi:hypothetical protein